MINKEDISHYTTSIEMVLKDLRRENDISQASANMEFEEKYGLSFNFGRTESNPNFRMITFLYICDYFNISIKEFSERILSKEKKDIITFLAKKEKRVKGRKKKNYKI